MEKIILVERRKVIERDSACCGNEDHVWFEDRWMVASLCDE
jgi:hypothetical protein